MSYCLGTQISWQMRYILSWLRKWKKMMETSDQRLDKNAPPCHIYIETRGCRLTTYIIWTVKLGVMLLGRCWYSSIKFKKYIIIWVSLKLLQWFVCKNLIITRSGLQEEMWDIRTTTYHYLHHLWCKYVLKEKKWARETTG